MNEIFGEPGFRSRCKSIDGTKEGCKEEESKEKEDQKEGVKEEKDGEKIQKEKDNQKEEEKGCFKEEKETGQEKQQKEEEDDQQKEKELKLMCEYNYFVFNQVFINTTINLKFLLISFNKNMQ